ncbi:hypothetical protein [Yinghuangia seranimata]|uniref:hypothetical protein n=1 Tax=Yinghuangia seranimata TaxID=408067 RepID=UPI00248C9C6B|nr:hypothetical protein [Yinghuangia seranimata]MDI2126635.1 hypothetical protein [Yinghuangia seranimata]
MGIFRRGGKQPDQDTAFPFLTRDEGVHLRHLVRGAFAARETAVKVYDTYATDAASEHAAASGNGTSWQFNLVNLASRCHELRGVRKWSDIVGEYVENAIRIRSLSERERSLQDLDPDVLRAALYPRVTSDAFYADTGLHTYARTLAPGLHELLAVAHDGLLHTLNDARTARFGTPEEAWQIAYANLNALPLNHFVREADNGARYVVVGDGSPHGAARLGVVDELVRRVTELDAVPENGILVAVPTRELLMFHRVGDHLTAVTPASMALDAAALYADAPYGVSPDVFWWHGGVLTRVTQQSPEGILINIAEGAFADMFERATGIRRGVDSADPHRS